ncbi:MAG: biotin/lipoyl-binding protein, partial [Bacilli bacterium]|nr:biotin/lipoyl-binding protein [Bacilli bacterium]
MRYLRKVLASLRKADELFSLIEEGDHIALGISGGKDSLCLLMAMSIYTKFSRKHFKIVPICLDLGFPGFDPKPMQEYAESLGLKLIVEDSREVYPILQSHVKKEGHLPCSICSRMKKAAINAAAKKYGCKKVAFAHHKDDALETLFMNMIHGGKVNTFEPMMHLEKADITFIRPFILVGEDDLIGMAKEENLPVMGKVCPADGYTERQYTKELLSSIYKEHPEAEENFSSMLYDYDGARLYFGRIRVNVGGGYAFAQHQQRAAAEKAAENQAKTGTASVTDITEKISSTGTIAPKDTYSITALVTGTIVSADFEEGDQVTKGQVLYQVDASSMDSQLTNNQNSLTMAEKNLAKAKENYAEAQARYGSGVYTATQAGYITAVRIVDGQKISNGTALLELTDDATMQVQIPFLSGEIVFIPVGSVATLTLSDTLEQVQGTVIAT